MGTIGRRPKTLATTVFAAVFLIVLALAFKTDVGDGSPSVTTRPAVLSLSDAVAMGDLDLASSLLDDGADPNKPLVHGFTPLMRAAIRNDTSMIRMLLDAGADLNATAMEGLTAWHAAAQTDAAAAIHEFITAGADLSIRSNNGMNTLEHAAATGSASVIVTIAETGVDLDAQSEIVTKGHGYPIDIGSTALGIAARAGHVEAIATLLDLGASVDAPSAVGHTPLLLAIFSGQPPELVSVLLEAGADPTVRAACRTRCSYEEGDALTWAHRLGDPEVIPLLQVALSK